MASSERRCKEAAAHLEWVFCSELHMSFVTITPEGMWYMDIYAILFLTVDSVITYKYIFLIQRNWS
jgi:hypothetical protein